MKNKTLILLLALFLFGLLEACSKSSNNPPASAVKNNLVYIYRNDSTDGSAFKKLFQSNGCSVTLIDRSIAGSFDYSAYKLIIVGNNTDTLGSASNWSPADAIAINNSGKPLLLMGEGGYLFANNIQDTVNWESSAGNSLSSFTIVDSGSVLYKKPNLIPIPVNLQLTIYTAASKVSSFYAKSTPVHNVMLMGQEGDVASSKYYPITLTDSRYGAFGFYGNVNAMTSTGKDYLVNLAYFVGNLSL